MNFLFPGAFAFAALIPLIVLWYLRRPRRRTLEVSTLMFWQRILEREPHRKFLGKLRHPLSLLLQLLIFLLLLLALARPEGRPHGRRSTVVVLDARARMQADGGRVFGDALRAAAAAASRAAADDEVAVLAVEGAPRIVSPFAADGKSLRERLAGVPVSDAGGGLEETLALARSLLEGRPGERRVVLVTDRPDPASGDAEVILTGAPLDNAGILALARRPLPASPQSAEVFVKLGNFSKSDRDLELELSLDGRPFDLQRLRVAAGGERDFSTRIPAEMLRDGKGFLTARILAEDGLAADNTARAAMATGQSIRVLLLTEDNPFLEGALKADSAVALEILRPESWHPDLARGFDAVVFDDFVPEGWNPAQPGAFFFFGRSPFDVPGEGAPAFALEAADPESPLLWHVDLAAVRVAQSRRLQSPKDGGWRASVPVENGGEPAVLALERADGSRVVATGFASGDSNFPLRVGFPLFVSNVLHWISGRTSDGDASLAAGRTFVPADGDAVARAPLKEESALSGESLAMTREPLRLRKSGFYAVGKEGGPANVPGLSRWLAVNTADRAESDLRQARADGAPAFFRGGLAGLHPWQWLALGAWILLLLEWFLHHRRITE